MARYFLIQNEVNTYPVTRIGKYDHEKAKKLLEDFGVTEIHTVGRKIEVRSSTGWGMSKDRVRLEELCFLFPEEQAVRESDRGQKIPAQADIFYAVRNAIVSELRGEPTAPGVSISQWHPKAEMIFNVASELGRAMGLDVAIEDHGILVDTREGGNVLDGVPGKQNRNKVDLFVRNLGERIPGVEVESADVDEWTGVMIPFDKMGEVEKPEVRKSPRPGR